MTSRAAAIGELIRTTLAAADQLDTVERDAIYTALVANLRSRRPEAVSPMTLGMLTAEIVRSEEFRTALRDVVSEVLAARPEATEMVSVASVRRSSRSASASSRSASASRGQR